MLSISWLNLPKQTWLLQHMLLSVHLEKLWQDIASCCRDSTLVLQRAIHMAHGLTTCFNTCTLSIMNTLWHCSCLKLSKQTNFTSKFAANDSLCMQ